MQIISWFWTLDYESSRVRPMSFLDLHKALCPNVTIQAKERYLEKSKTGNCKQTTGPRARMSNTPEAKHVSVSESAPTLNGRIHARTEKPSHYRCSCRLPLRSLLSLPRVEA